MMIQLLHSITHDGVEYGPGVHDIDEELAEIFLAIRHAVGDVGEIAIARPFEPRALMGETRKAPDAPTSKARTV